MDKIKFIGKRLLMTAITMLLVTFVVFFVIQLPPGDYVDTMVAQMVAEGERISPAEIEMMKEAYGMNDPFLVQYVRWLGNILTGD